MGNKLVKIMIILLIFIIIIAGIIISIIVLNKDENLFTQNSNIGDAGEVVNYKELKLHDVTEKIEYYTVKNCINSYIKALNKESGTYYIADQYDEKIQKEYIYNLFSDSYINNKKITKENVLNNVKLYDENLIFTPLKMKVLENENSNVYVAYGIVQNLQNKYIEDLYIIVSLDLKNKTYQIEPIDELYNSIEDIVIENNNVIIKNNGFNSYITQKISNEFLCSEYLTLYKNLSLSKPEVIYNLMSNEYRNKRFGSLENFKNYIEENRKEIEKIKLSQYAVTNYDNYTEYIAKDQYENLYIFKETEFMYFTISLDTYTLEQEKFNTEYSKATNNNKVKMNIDKLFQMINAKDYNAAYEMLDANFKNTNFKTVQSFEQYMKSKLYRYNDISFIKFSDEISGVYTYSIEITNREDEFSQKIKMNIVMQLLENTNYKYSFEIVNN